MRHHVFDGLILDRFPGPGHGADKAPAPGRIVDGALLDHLDILLGALGRIALHKDPLRPRGRDKAPDHLTKQRIFRLIRWMAFRSDQTKSHRQALHVPVGNQQGQADPEQPGVMFTFPSFLGQGVLCAPLGGGKVAQASWAHHATSRCTCQ